MDTNKPFHNAFQLVGSGYSFASFSFYVGRYAFGQDLGYVLAGSGYIFSSFSVSTYDGIPQADSTNIEEDIDSSDNLWTNVPSFGENIQAQDSFQGIITVAVDEAVDSLDDVFVDASHAYVFAEEDLPSQDYLNILENIVVTEEEDLNSLDTGTARAIVSVNDEEDITVQETDKVSFDITYEDTIKIRVSALYDYEDTVTTNVYPTTVVSVTDYTSATNPFLPTIIIDGTTIAYNIATDPGGVFGSRMFISLANTGIIGSSLCSVISFTLNLTMQGGRWSLITTAPASTLGQTITIFGLTGATQEVGEGVSRQYGHYFTCGGSFTPDYKMDMPVAALAASYPFIAQLFPSNNTGTPKSSVWSTVRSTMQAIATAAGISVGFMANDAPLTDATQFAGGTVGSALSTLASMVGASLVWNGSSGYLISYPDMARGSWSVPNCKLITPGGIYQNHFQNLRPWQGVMLPNSNKPNAGFVGTAEFVPLSSLFKPNATLYSGPAKVEFDGQVTKLLDGADYRDIQLKPGYKTVMAQIVTISDSSGTYVTTDPAVWFPYGGAVISKPDGTKWARVTAGDMPSANTDVSGGTFHMQIGHTRDLSGLSDSYLQKAQEYDARNSSQQSNSQAQFKFVQTSEGFINCILFGGIPLPGMVVTATLDGYTVLGIAQSVTVSMPGTINVNFATFQRYGAYQPTASITAPGSSGGEGTYVGGFLNAT